MHKWKLWKRNSLTIQRCSTGSRWYFGNFLIGLEIAHHPRWIEFCFGLGFWEVILVHRK